ncbi:TPA: hypothetical protein ACJ6J3_09565 [Legionella pneumophila]|uniref:hypothetical protein n=1 Tax=Legionella pneumophila TaxID=446 RepID=UPI0007774E8D|nr:hypothetical protein [Legionella pneumophila]
MSHLNTINHRQFDKLYQITQNYNQAILLDKLIFWWQISKFTFNDQNKWFTRSLDKIAAEANISKRSIQRYIERFIQLGLIEKKVRLFKKIHLFLRVTDKLLNLLNKENQSTPSQLPSKEKTNSENNGVFLNQCGVFKKDTVSDSIIKDKENKKVIVNNHFLDEKEKLNIGYVVDDFLNKIGTEKPHLKISSPQQLKKELIFSLQNKAHQFPGITTLTHCLNIIAKLLQEKKWRTPKGYRKYTLDKVDSQHPPSAQQNTMTGLHSLNGQWREILNDIATETRYLTQLKGQFEKKQTDNMKALIANTEKKIAHLEQMKNQLVMNNGASLACPTLCYQRATTIEPGCYTHPMTP